MPDDKVSIAYLAGFFDGEGCIHLARKGAGVASYTARVTISQSKNRGKVLLDKIAFTLSTYGISCHIGVDNRISKLHPSVMYNLQINSRLSVSKFIKLVMPYLEIKKLEAQDILRFLSIYRGCSEPIRIMLIKEHWAKKRGVKCL